MKTIWTVSNSKHIAVACFRDYRDASDFAKSCGGTYTWTTR